MTWHSAISPPHRRLWARLVKDEYIDGLRMWSTLKQRPQPVASQINYYDDAPLGPKKTRICCWLNILQTCESAGLNPLHMVQLAFRRSITENHSDYPRPHRLAVPGMTPRQIQEGFDEDTTTRIKSDIGFLNRCREEVDILVGDDASQADVQLATETVIAESITSLVLRSTLLSQSKKLDSATVRAFLLAPSIYITLVPDLLPPKLLKLRNLNGSIVAR